MSVNPPIRKETLQESKRHEPQPQLTHEKEEEEVVNTSDLTIVLAVLGSIVILLLVVLMGLLWTTSKRKVRIKRKWNFLFLN